MSKLPKGWIEACYLMMWKIFLFQKKKEKRFSKQVLKKIYKYKQKAISMDMINFFGKYEWFTWL